MVVDLPPHRPRLADHGIGQIVGIGSRSVHDDRQRRLQRMRQVARVPPRLLRLAFIMLDERV